MHQITIHLQGGQEASVAQVVASLDLVKGRLLAGMSNGTGREGNVGFEFEHREVDADHAMTHLLARTDRDEYLVASAEQTRQGNRT
ncbi:hypothetical protein [Ottowia sp.]|uniref:hypothetical protein n=1 Tax=Ottowia sp. TaxID=1898956 RepID=UPI0025F10B3E|nr:hypothetical protein [Ottowia sp.]MBK6616499.1 hypothetical protein [Ottowia sp.]